MSGRLVQAMQAIPIYRVEQGTLVYGEIMAYEVGLQMIETWFSTLVRELFVKEASTFGLIKWEDALALESSGMEITMRQKNVVEALSRVQGLSDFNHFQSKLEAINQKIILAATGNEISLQNVAHGNNKELSQLARLLLPMVSPIAHLTLGKSGKTWVQWEEAAHSWNDCDKLGQPFDFLDTV